MARALRRMGGRLCRRGRILRDPDRAGRSTHRHRGASALRPRDVCSYNIVAEVTLDHRFVQLSGIRPRTIGSDFKARYLCTRDGGVEKSTGSTTITKALAIAPTITAADFELYGLPGNKNRIRTFGRIVDLNGGASLDFEILIDKTNSSN